MKNIGLIIITLVGLLTGRNGFAQTQDSASFKLFLIGDAGAEDTTEPYSRFENQLLKNPNMVIFLGRQLLYKIILLYRLMGGYNGNKQDKGG
jgi:hypothetical protein